MVFDPKPRNTSEIQLPDDILQLVERLAEDVHNLWARQRLQEGWTWGPDRDDQARKHPGLIPYAELSETEKNYDRSTALHTLKTILALGYRIEKD